MPAAKNVGEPRAGEPHARFDAAAGGIQASRRRRAAEAPLADPPKTPIGHRRGERSLAESQDVGSYP